VTPAGVVPRLKQFTVAGTFDSGHYEYDSALALVHLDDAARCSAWKAPPACSCGWPTCSRARGGARAAGALGPGVVVRDWTRTNRNWFDAVQIEKRLMFIILTLIVAVAAFNLVSTLVMTVTDKRADIAILRTLGASPRSIMGIFMVQGAAAGIIGTFGRRGAGAAGGLQHRRHRAGHRAPAGRGLPARQHLPHQPHAQRAAGQRHRAHGA
jgi:lipoprotein-releasing system permease protein